MDPGCDKWTSNITKIHYLLCVSPYKALFWLTTGITLNCNHMRRSILSPQRIRSYTPRLIHPPRQSNTPSPNSSQFIYHNQQKTKPMLPISPKRVTSPYRFSPRSALSPPPRQQIVGSPKRVLRQSIARVHTSPQPNVIQRNISPPRVSNPGRPNNIYYQMTPQPQRHQHPQQLQQRPPYNQ